MSAVPAGYRLAVVTPDGSIAEMVDIEGYNLTKTIAAAALGHDIAEAVGRAVAGQQ